MASRGAYLKRPRSSRVPHFAVKSRSKGVPFSSLGSRPSFHFRLPLPVISATAPGVFAARRVWCRTSSCRNTHFDFQVGVGDFAMVPGGVLSTPVSAEGFTSRRPDAAGELDFLEHCFIAKCVLIGSSNYFFTAGPKRSTSSFQSAMILAFVFRAL